jgi:hypothetical protein
MDTDNVNPVDADNANHQPAALPADAALTNDLHHLDLPQRRLSNPIGRGGSRAGRSIFWTQKLHRDDL